ncbi:hypothetical protein COP1_031113 [Malus domestica]
MSDGRTRNNTHVIKVDPTTLQRLNDQFPMRVLAHLAEEACWVRKFSTIGTLVNAFVTGQGLFALGRNDPTFIA